MKFLWEDLPPSQFSKDWKTFMKVFPLFRSMLKTFSNLFSVQLSWWKRLKLTWQQKHNCPAYLLVVHCSCSNEGLSPVDLVYLLLWALNPRHQNRSGPRRTEYSPRTNLTGSWSPCTTKMKLGHLNKWNKNWEEQNKFWQNLCHYDRLIVLMRII